MTDPAISLPAAVTSLTEIHLERLRELQRFAELGRLSASLLHELSNPLTAAILHLEQHQSQPDNLRHIQRSIRLMQSYVEAARQQLRHESQAKSFHLRPQVDQVKRILSPLARHSDVRLNFTLATNSKPFGDPVKFQHVLANLVSNAIRAYDGLLLPAPERLVQITITASKQWLILEVADGGCGIAAEQLPFIFEPFYTTKGQSGRGLGIGLAVVKQYVETDFQGSISVRSFKRRGTVFRAKLRLSS